MVGWGGGGSGVLEGAGVSVVGNAVALPNTVGVVTLSSSPEGVLQLVLRRRTMRMEKIILEFTRNCSIWQE
jgi:hypothetical protein